MSGAGASLDGLRILIVEDESLVAHFLAELLAVFGCQVAGIAETVAASLALIDAPGADFDGVLLDINLNGETVYPVADRLVALQLPFAFVTGYEESAIDPRFSTVPILRKPFRPPELAALVASIAIRR